MLSAPVHRETNAAGTGPLHCTGDVSRETSSTIVVHSLNHFVHTSNPKVFPFVPVTMRGCGYRKRSGEVVPCIIFEFSPDSNQVRQGTAGEAFKAVGGKPRAQWQRYSTIRRLSPPFCAAR